LLLLSTLFLFLISAVDSGTKEVSGFLADQVLLRLSPASGSGVSVTVFNHTVRIAFLPSRFFPFAAGK